MQSVKGTACFGYLILFFFPFRPKVFANQMQLILHLWCLLGVRSHFSAHQGILVCLSAEKIWSLMADMGGPRRLFKPSKRRLKDDTDVLGVARVSHPLFVCVNLKADQGSSVTSQNASTLPNLSYDLLRCDLWRIQSERGEGIYHLPKHAKVAYCI